MSVRSGSVRSAVARAKEAGADVQSLEIRAGTLTHEVIALEARASSIAGFLDTAPLAGDRRFAETAGVAAGAAVARTRDAGPGDLARAVRNAARARGSAEQIETLLDVAAAALAWATVLSLADDERSAAMPTRGHGKPNRLTPASAPRTAHHLHGRRPLPPAVYALRSGELRAVRVLLGVCSASERRQLSTLTVAQLLAEDPGTRALIQGTYLAVCDTPVGLLTPEERHDMAYDLVNARETQLAEAA